MNIVRKHLKTYIAFLLYMGGSTLCTYHALSHLKQMVQLHLPPAVQHQLGSVDMAAWNEVPPVIFCLYSCRLLQRSCSWSLCSLHLYTSLAALFGPEFGSHLEM